MSRHEQMLSRPACHVAAGAREPAAPVATGRLTALERAALFGYPGPRRAVPATPAGDGLDRAMLAALLGARE